MIYSYFEITREPLSCVTLHHHNSPATWAR